MEFGVISDIHGNVVALEAVLEDMPPVDALVCAGDVVGYNPWHAECVDELRSRAVPTVMGNHDRAVVHGNSFSFKSMAGAGVQHARETLGVDHLDWLRELPDEHRLFDERVKVVHGHPRHPDRYTYPGMFGSHLLGDEDVLIMGHTHQQHHEIYDEGVVLNPGSVGQPRDCDVRAAYAVVDLDDLSVAEHRVEYDIDRVRDAIREAGLPVRIGDRLYEGR